MSTVVHERKSQVYVENIMSFLENMANTNFLDFLQLFLFFSINNCSPTALLLELIIIVDFKRFRFQQHWNDIPKNYNLDC